MSKPTNPLDIFVTYTYHFELHIANSWDELKKIETLDSNDATKPNLCNKTLIINTRKDAHQVIDDVNFNYLTPGMNPNGEFSATGELHLNVIEPNGSLLIEKLERKMGELKASTLGSLQFGLKIFFVGRLETNEIKTIAMQAIIPLHFLNSSATFTAKGGEYSFRFAVNSSFLISRKATGMGQAFGYCNKNISLNAKSVKEALTQLEVKLNENYDYSIKNEIDIGRAKKIKYFVNFSSEIDGKISLISRESFSSDDQAHHYLDQNQSILTWINNITRSSESLNKTIGESFNGINKSGHTDVKLISIPTRFLIKNDVLEIHYDVTFYKGSLDDVYEFDFMFGKPGLNVDVLSFDINFKDLNVWFAATSKSSVDSYTNQSGQLASGDPTQYAKIQTVDAAANQLTTQPNKIITDQKAGDLAALSPNSNGEQTGYNDMNHNATPSYKLMFNTITAAHAATENQLKFNIRGNLELLMRGIMYPDENLTSINFKSKSKTPVGVRSPTWIKVNIKSPNVPTLGSPSNEDGEPNGNHSPFYYTGRYLLTGINNSFSQGRFTQTLTVQMVSKEQQS